jgi:hypothetical protein
MASIIPNSQFSKIFNPQDDSIPMAQKTKISSPVAINQNPVIRTAGMFMEPIQPNQLSLSLMSQSTTEPQDDESGRFLASLIAQGAAGFGTGMMGGSAADIQRSAGTFQTMRDTQENQRRAKQLTDPNSEESKRRREVYKSLGFQVPNNLSATDLNDPTVLQTLKGQMEQSRLATMPRGGVGVGGVGKTKEEKPKERKLSQDERALLNNSALAYKALFDMEDAIKKGKSRTSYLGDNEYTYAANRFVEGIGRMQSGGAIGPDEVENFKKLIPGRFDSDELSKQKIKDMKAELESRLKSINYDPKEVLQSRTPSIDFNSEE